MDVYRCLVCKKYHALKACPKFLRMDTEERNRVVRHNNYCVNCLAKSHTFRSCKSKNACRRCNHYHHTLLHHYHPRVRGPVKSRLAVTNDTKGEQQPKKKPGKEVSRNQSGRKHKRPPMEHPTDAVIPNQTILCEAIKSLATVLCVTSKRGGNSPARRHV